MLIQSLEAQIHTLRGCLNTAEIGEHTLTPSGYINTVPVNLTCMVIDNLNICAVNKYADMFGDNSNM